MLARLSASEPAKDLILVHTVQLKQMIIAQIRRMVSSGISYVRALQYTQRKPHLKKLMMMKMIIITEKPFTSK